MIEVVEVSKRFDDLRRGEVRALEAVTLRCYPGQICGLLGPNGAGKTTMLRILATVLQPSTGSARVAGHDVVTDPEGARRSIGYVSGSTGIYDRMTAWELVEYFGRLHGLEPQPLRQRMDKLFTTLAMNDFRDVLGAKMSTGMKQKVSIARALVHDPPVMILDEPTAGLDVMVARAVLDQIRALRTLGKCVLFSTHIMREVEKLCDHVVIIHRGRVLEVGTIPELRNRHGDELDMEEMFFHLIDRAEAAPKQPA